MAGIISIETLTNVLSDLVERLAGIREYDQRREYIQQICNGIKSLSTELVHYIKVCEGKDRDITALKIRVAELEAEVARNRAPAPGRT